MPALPADRTVRVTVILLFSAWLIDYADRFVISVALPAIGTDFDLSRSQQGMIVSAFFLAYALCQIPGGMIVDRFGGVRVTVWAILAWSVFTALTGFAWSFLVLLALRFAFGVAEGVFPAASLKVLVERTPVEQRMSANGLIMSSNAIAAVLTPLIAPVLITIFGWRSLFYSVAAVGILVFVLLRAKMPPPLASAGPHEPTALPLSRTREVLRAGVLWRFSAIMFGYNLIGWGLSTWAPSYLTAERGLSLTTAGPLMALPALAAAAATVLGGRLSDRMQGNHRRVIVPAMTVAAVSLLALAQSSSLLTFIFFATVAIFAASLAYMPIFAVPLCSLPPAYIGVGTAIIGFGGQVAGVVAPTAMGLIADHLSFGAAFAFLGLGALIAAVMALLTPQNSASFLAAFGRSVDSRSTEDQPAKENS